MKIYLISPTHYTPDGNLVKSVQYWTSAITLPYLKALTPSRHTVTFSDELFYDVDVNSDADLIGLTAMGPQIARAYDLADYFRSRGKKVVMGGSWVSLNPAEALLHCDAVVKGEAELVWEQLLDDVESGVDITGKIYWSEKWHSMVGLPKFDYTTLPLFLPGEVQALAVLSHVLPLADPGVARLSASLRVLLGADLLQPHVPLAARRGSDRGHQDGQGARRQAPPVPRRQSDRQRALRQRAVQGDDPAQDGVGRADHHQHRAQ